MSDFKKYNYCRFCESKNITQILNLGNQPLAGGFLKNPNYFKKEKKYPLELYFCKNCFLVQTSVVINESKLFKNYFYSSSNILTLVNHFKTFGRLLKKKYTKNNFIIEIGSNDGIFLKILKNEGFKTLGIDPSENLSRPLIKKGYNVINDFFSEKIAKRIVKKFGEADIIVSSNTLAHIENMHEIARGIKSLLKPQGILIFENHYLLDLLHEVQYDMVYHEHQYYYSLLTLINFFNMHDMEIFNAEKIPTHSGSIRVYVQNKNTGKNKISENLKKLLKEEIKFEVDKIKTYKVFQKNVELSRKKLLGLIIKLKKQNKIISGYGASGRGTVISNFCNLDSKTLEFVIDDSKIKQGLYTPGNHLKIISSDILKKTNKPDFILLFAWSFIEEIRNRNKTYLKNGGRFIVPLPKAKII